MNLIKLGLSTQETTAFGYPVLEELWLMERSAEEVVNAMRLLVLSGELDEYLPSLFQRTGNYIASDSIESELFSHEAMIRRMVSQLVWSFPGVLQIMATEFHEFQIDPKQLPPVARFASLDWRDANPDLLLDEIGRGGGWDTASFEAVLRGPNFNNLDAFAEAYFFGVQSLTDGVHEVWKRDFGTEPKLESWRKLARRVLSAASMEALTQTDPVSVYRKHNLSPLFRGLFYLNSYFRWFDIKKRRWRRRMSRAVVMWLEDVPSSGTDLDEYGAAVRKLYLDNAWLHSWRWHLFGGRGPRLVALTSGPKPEDWKLHWDWDWHLDDDRFAGEFWEMTENPPLRIPGGWVD